MVKTAPHLLSALQSILILVLIVFEKFHEPHPGHHGWEIWRFSFYFSSIRAGLEICPLLHCPYHSRKTVLNNRPTPKWLGRDGELLAQQVGRRATQDVCAIFVVSHVISNGTIFFHESYHQFAVEFTSQSFLARELLMIGQFQKL